jgi:hypothetical protein
MEAPRLPVRTILLRHPLSDLVETCPRPEDRSRSSKTYPRSIHNVAGVIFLDTRGDETGGLAFAKLRNDGIDNLSFDYTFQPTDGIRMWKEESPNGKWWRTAFEIFDRRPYQPGPPTSSQGIERMALSDENENASLVISDPQGHPRIRIGVDREGKPEIEMLNAEGRVIYRESELKSAARAKKARKSK